MTLDELRALCEAVTPGEWHAWAIYNPTWPPSVPRWSFGNTEVSPDDLSEADARFIAAARTYMPALLSRINELETQEKELAAARLEIVRLRGALEGARVEHMALEEDCWFSCPKSGHCCNEELPKDRCTCGADYHNAQIDAALEQPPE